MKEFIEITVKPQGELYGAYLTCKEDPYSWWLLRSFAPTPAEAVQNVCTYFLMDDWSSVGYEIDPGVRLKDVTCPQCDKEFTLTWRDYDEAYSRQKETLVVRSCPSGGIYNVEIRCPHCNYVEEL